MKTKKKKYKLGELFYAFHHRIKERPMVGILIKIDLGSATGGVGPPYQIMWNCKDSPCDWYPEEMLKKFKDNLIWYKEIFK